MPNERQTEGGRRRGAVLLTLLLLLLLPAVVGAAQAPIDGAPSAGDPYFPRLGNGAYDVRHYEIALRIDPKRRVVRGTAGIELVPTVPLRSFTLDLIGLEVDSVEIDGAPARFERADRKLRIEPAAPLAADRPVVVRVAYGGSPKTSSPYTGWLWFDGGGATLSQPDGAATLFPCNDHPSDKATFSFDLTTPRGTTAVANGVPTPQPAPDDQSERVIWTEAEPFPTYAALVAVGTFELVRETGPGGLPIINALPPKDAGRLGQRLARQGEIVATLERAFGPYPYSSIGAVVTPQRKLDPVEAAGRPIYPGLDRALTGKGFEQLVAHEIAHQWFGNAIGLVSYRDIWLNEGFATYGELLWIAEQRGVPIGSLFARDSDVFGYYPSMKRVPPGDPGAERLFNVSVYNRGALTLEALRRTVGDDAFADILRAYVDRYRGGNATTADFISVAESTSGQNLDRFFDAWLYQRPLPELPPER